MSRFARMLAAATLALFPALLPATGASATTDDIAWVATWRDNSQAPDAMNSVQKVNVTTGEVLDRIALPDARPSELAYSGSTKMLWAISEGWQNAPATVVAINTETGEYDPEVIVEGNNIPSTSYSLFYANDQDGNIIASPDGSRIYVTGHDNSDASGVILVFDAESTDLLGVIPLENNLPYGLAINAAANDLYVRTLDNSDESRIETVDLGTSDFANAVIDVSPALDWDGDSCSSNGSITYDAVNNLVYGVCWEVQGWAMWNPTTDAVNGSTLSELSGDSTLGVAVSSDGEYLALGSCYWGSAIARPDFDGTYTDGLLLDHGGETSKFVSFYANDTRYVTGSWSGLISTYAVGDSTPTDTYLLDENGDVMSGDPYSYVSALAWVDEAPALAETGFDSTPLIAFAVLTILGGAVVIGRRIRA